MQSVAPNKRPVNMVFQHLALFPMMSVGENVGYGLAQRGMGASEMKRRVGEMLERVGLSGVQSRGIEQLSGGQKQRVAIARSLVLEPTLLLLDEPLGALDKKLRVEVQAQLKEIHRRVGTTFVYVTHDQEEALSMSDRIVIMQNGRIEQVDDPVSLYTVPKTRFVAGFIGRTNFLDGRVEGNQIVFPGFTVPADLAPDAKSLPRDASFSVRPQTIAIQRTAPTSTDRIWWVQGKVTERAYLGEYWEYGVRPADSDIRMRVSTPPTDMYQIDESVWLGIDPARSARVPAPGKTV